MKTSADPILSQSQSPENQTGRWATVAALCALAMLFLAQVAPQNTLDLDLYHQMALVRAAIAAGRMPIEDIFAYTSHAGPSVHYEWGNGALAYAVSSEFGVAGLLVLKYVLTALAATLALHVARRRGATWPAIIVLAPGAALLMSLGFTTIRAGLFTLVFTAITLALLERDRRGKRAWVLPWLVLYVAWVNIHPGFIVGASLMALHWLERLIRFRRPQWHLIGAGFAMMLLVFVNPYGRLYPMALWHALTMKLPPIPEWEPIWKLPEWHFVMIYSLTLAIALYAVMRGGWRRCEGIFMLAACALSAFQHVRHLYFYALVWVCYVPGWLTISPLGEAITRAWVRRPQFIAAASAIIALMFIPAIVKARPWTVHFPVSLDDPDNVKEGVLYPVGAVDYLKRLQFHGNVMSHYNDGSYVMWHMWPAVKIGLDSRNDVGYSYDFIMEILAFYHGKPGWRQTLDRYPTDLVLIKRSFPLGALMGSHTNWRRIYRDDAFELWARPGLALPIEDRTGQKLSGTFP